MPTTKIRKDAHGLYVRTDGKVYRPVKTPYSYEIAHARNSKEDGSSAFEEGAEVKAQHRSQTPFATVARGAVLEWWHGHGEYIGKKSEECWTPVTER